MTEEKIIELVRRIEEKSRGGQLNWEKTALENEFQATLAKYVIRIWHSGANDRENDYYISIVDNDGQIIERFGDSQLTKMAAAASLTMFGPFGASSAFEVMESIFKHARRRALGVDKAIDDILSELE